MKDWVLQRSVSSPRSEAIVNPHSGKTLDYRELDNQIDKLSNRFLKLGVERRENIGILLDTSFKSVKVVHSLIRIGCILVFFNTRLSEPELENRIKETDVSVVICDENTKEDVPDEVSYISISSENNRNKTVKSIQNLDLNPYSWSEDEVVLIMFTSGTTGRPKSVKLTIKNIMFSAISSGFRLGIPETWHLCLPIYHMGGFSPIMRSALYGSKIIVQSGFDPKKTTNFLEEYNISAISLVPAMLKDIIRSSEIPNCLDIILLGGSPINKELVKKCEKEKIPIYPTYGLTETSSQVATTYPEEVYSNPKTVGNPLIFTEVNIVDENGNIVNKNEVGEIVVSGPTVTPGYYNKGKNNFGEYGLYTGDKGYLDDENRLYVTGRISDIIITGGENVDPKEVSNVLSNHPKIQNSVIVGIDDDRWGEKIATVVVPKESDLSKDKIKKYCRKKLASYKIPKVIEFRENIPKTHSGTVDRKKIKDILE